MENFNFVVIPTEKQPCRLFFLSGGGGEIGFASRLASSN